MKAFPVEEVDQFKIGIVWNSKKGFILMRIEIDILGQSGVHRTIRPLDNLRRQDGVYIDNII